MPMAARTIPRSANLNPVTVNFRNCHAFGYASYKITPDIQASVQLNYGKSDVVIHRSTPA